MGTAGARQRSIEIQGIYGQPVPFYLLQGATIMVRIVQKTWHKMSPQAHALALKLPMSPASAAIVKEALTPG